MNKSGGIPPLKIGDRVKRISRSNIKHKFGTVIGFTPDHKVKVRLENGTICVNMEHDLYEVGLMNSPRP